MSNLDSILKSRDITWPTKVHLVKAMFFPVVMYGCESWTPKKPDSWESLGLQAEPISQFKRKSVLNIHGKDWCWSWNSNTLATWCEKLTPWRRPWGWERLKAGEGDDRGWNGWMASPTRWAWVWASSGCWWWTGKLGTLQSTGLQRVRHDWAAQLKWKK